MNMICPTPHTFKPRRGFTLVELLVVIAIIAILAAFLMPALRRSMEVARAATCISNFRQYGMAVQTYTNEYNNWLPLCTNIAGAGTTYWPTLLAAYLGGGSWNYGWSGSTPKSIPKLFQCPSGPNEIEFGLNVSYYKRVGTLSNGAPYLGLSWMDAERLSDARNPSGAVLMADGENKTRSPGGFAFEYSGSNSPTFVDYRHNRGINILFVDGHARWTPFPWTLPVQALNWAH